MPRKKSYSSELAKIFDTSVVLSQQIKNFQETVAGLMTDSERLKEIEPLLNDINRVAAVMNPVKPPTEPPGDQPPPPDDEQPPPPTPAPVKKRRERARKIISTGTIPGDQN